jgi:hypothetical protein
LCLLHLPLGVPNWSVNTAPSTSFLSPLPGIEEEAPTSTRRRQVFWRRCRGERGFLQGDSLTSNLFIFLLFCLFSLIYFLFASFYQKYKKLVPTIVVIFVGLLLSCFIMLSING